MKKSALSCLEQPTSAASIRVGRILSIVFGNGISSRFDKYKQREYREAARSTTLGVGEDDDEEEEEERPEHNAASAGQIDCCVEGPRLCKRTERLDDLQV